MGRVSKEQNAKYHRDWYQRNRVERQRQINERRTRLRIHMRKVIHRLKSLYRCKDCDRRYAWYVMEFDHVPERESRRTQARRFVNAGQCSELSELRSELKLCDLVCANCHRVRTFERNQQGHLTGSATGSTQDFES